MSVDRIQFWHGGRVVEVTDVPATTTVLDWLRGSPDTRGTKEGCNQGDCGACTVALGDLAHDGTDLRISTANACLLLLPMLHGRALFTIEDLADSRGSELHPAQQAMAKLHGSQCGFCTPGIVMSLWAMHHTAGATGHEPTRQELADGLAGNLCRCTGYRPVLDAGQRMMHIEADGDDTASAVAALRSIDVTMLDYRTSTTRFWAPVSTDELADLVAGHPEARLLAGGTDVVLTVTQLHGELPELIWTGRVASLGDVTEDAAGVRIGSSASLEEAWSCLTAHVPTLREMWLRFASPAIRQVGTMGGNVINGSPIGDAAPVLLALDAQLELRRGDLSRRLPLKDFYLGYQSTALAHAEFLTAIIVPRSALGREVRAYKVSRRFDSDIAAVSAAFALRLTDGILSEVRLAYGGLGPIVRRAESAERVLTGRLWDESALRKAQEALAADFTPMTDHRATAAYRMQVAAGLLERLWLQTRAVDPMPARETVVWSRT
jgi:xanthine dehydrogenase small subunit